MDSAPNGDGKEGIGQEDENMVGATRWQKAAKLKEKEKLKNEAAGQTLMGKGEGKSAKSKSGKPVEEKPLSDAARRRKIKEEILDAGEGEGFKGYRRRVW